MGVTDDFPEGQKEDTMAKLVKAALVVLGIAAGAVLSWLQLGAFGLSVAVLDYLMIVNCAFFITLLTARDEPVEFQPVAFLFWVMVLSPVVSMVLFGFTMDNLARGISFSLANRFLADCLLRLILRLVLHVPHNSEDDRATRLMFHDNLFKRFFRVSLLTLLHMDGDE